MTVHLKKGSKEAKDYMARLRAMRGKRGLRGGARGRNIVVDRSRASDQAYQEQLQKRREAVKEYNRKHNIETYREKQARERKEEEERKKPWYQRAKDVIDKVTEPFGGTNKLLEEGKKQFEANGGVEGLKEDVKDMRSADWRSLKNNLGKDDLQDALNVGKQALGGQMPDYVKKLNSMKRLGKSIAGGKAISNRMKTRFSKELIGTALALGADEIGKQMKAVSGGSATLTFIKPKPKPAPASRPAPKKPLPPSPLKRGKTVEESDSDEEDEEDPLLGGAKGDADDPINVDEEASEAASFDKAYDAKAYTERLQAVNKKLDEEGDTQLTPEDRKLLKKERKYLMRALSNLDHSVKSALPPHLEIGLPTLPNPPDVIIDEEASAPPVKRRRRTQVGNRTGAALHSANDDQDLRGNDEYYFNIKWTGPEVKKDEDDLLFDLALAFNTDFYPLAKRPKLNQITCVLRHGDPTNVEQAEQIVRSAGYQFVPIDQEEMRDALGF